MFDNERYIGISHYYLENFDSCHVYLKRADDYYSMSEVKRMPILPYLIIAKQKIGDDQASKDLLEEFKRIAENNDAEKKDFILANWASYEVLSLLGEKKEAKVFLENAYFEVKSRSRDIKNKSDRNKYLSSTFHSKINDAWSN